ncbi:MAG TPA: hypothetical protein DDY52_01425 [Candidatus Moranbacteria bacterium]|nr:MAG: hypothetical protein UR51_C0007G0033 [Candidatus Moranbacteria bacterium GW2011_GWF1_34_10]HBI16805.1 hypothetical protein [Candidatus Moranbacteria bacterium]
MVNKNKKGFLRNISVYFVFVALAFGISAYFLLLDNYNTQTARINILISPQNTKTAVYLNRIKENIVIIADKKNIFGENVVLKNDPKNDLIEISASGEDRAEASLLAEKSTSKLLNLISKYYNVKNDLSLQVVSVEFQSKTNYFLIAGASILIGLILALFIQLILDLSERASLFFIKRRMESSKKNAETENYLGDFFKTNREKIQKLSSSFPLEKSRDKQTVSENKIIADSVKNKLADLNDEPYVNFKKAAFPSNLPVAEDDLDKIIQHKEDIPNEKEVLNELGIFPESETQDLFLAQDESNLEDTTKEPTEEEFKKRLNELLGNK